METSTKLCSKCGRELPHESFSPNPRNADGRMATCKECMNAARNARREKAVPIPPTVETATAKPDSDPDLGRPVEVMDLSRVNNAPYNTIEIPSSGWLAYVPDDVLYGELIRRGWSGPMKKTLAAG